MLPMVLQSGNTVLRCRFDYSLSGERVGREALMRPRGFPTLKAGRPLAFAMALRHPWSSTIWW